MIVIAVEPTTYVSVVGAVVLGAGGMWLTQRNRSGDRKDKQVLANTEATADVTVAALNQWQEIVAAQGRIQAQQVVDIAALRDRADSCEAECRALKEELREREREIRELQRDR